MDLRRLRPAEGLLTAAGLALVLSLFLPWYGLRGVEFSAWQAFSVVDAILFVCGVSALLAVALQATQRTPALPIVSATAATWGGILATVLVVVKLLDHPMLGFAKTPELRYGAWVGLA